VSWKKYRDPGDVKIAEQVMTTAKQWGLMIAIAAALIVAIGAWLGRAPAPATAKPGTAVPASEAARAEPFRRAPDVPAGTRLSGIHIHVVLPNALPISLAIVSLAAVTIAVTPARIAGDGSRMPMEITAAHAKTPVLAIALPGPRRPPRSSAMPSAAFRLWPMSVVAAAKANAANSNDQACHPAPSQTITPMANPVAAPATVTFFAAQPPNATTRVRS